MKEISSRTFDFLLDSYETEVLKTVGIWSAFPDAAADFRPAPQSRTVMEQFEHQVQSEWRWMTTMLAIETGDPYPTIRTRDGFIEKYQADSAWRLDELRSRPDDWWIGQAQFFDVVRTRAWIFTRRLTHSAHHRAQLVVYLRLLGLRVPSVYGPTADTHGRVVYAFR